MSIIVNGTEITDVKFNNTTLDMVVFNGTIVFEDTDPLAKPFQVTLLESDSFGSLHIRKLGTYDDDEDVYWTGSYSTDRIVWHPLVFSEKKPFVDNPSYWYKASQEIVVEEGGSVYIKGDYSADNSTTSYLDLDFEISSKWKASGNINSLHTSTNFKNLTSLQYNYCFDRLLDRPEVWDASELLLPATQLTIGCYRDLLSGSNITSAPDLPADYATFNCYFEMFCNCTRLTTAPKIYATRAFADSMAHMFDGCTSLTTVPKLNIALTSNYSNISRMFAGCTSLQVSDTQTADAPYAWRLPTTGVFLQSSSTNTHVFDDCLGTRASDDITVNAGEYKVYYTQNQPIG